MSHWSIDIGSAGEHVDVCVSVWLSKLQPLHNPKHRIWLVLNSFDINFI